MSVLATEREQFSRMLRVAARSGDLELAADASAALRRLGNPPTLPRRPRRVVATKKGRVSCVS